LGASDGFSLGDGGAPGCLSDGAGGAAVEAGGIFFLLLLDIAGGDTAGDI
jgi:hypothetical protein